VWTAIRTRVDDRRDGVVSTSERDEECVPLRVDDDTLMLPEPTLEKLPVIGQQPFVRLAEVLEQSGRALDVREHHRDGARG
jgi:hypothetical protein